jgi:aminopeptidase N
LIRRDTDGFNRWDSAQSLYTAAILKVIHNEAHDESLDRVLKTFDQTLKDEGISDDSIRAYTLILPSESTLSKAVNIIDPPAILKARNHVKQIIARTFKNDLLLAYKKLTAAINADGATFKVDGASVGRRRLRNVYLGYLCTICQTGEEQKESATLATEHFNAATGMTDKLAAFSILASMSGEGAIARDAAIEKFYNDANYDPLVLNKWFSVQADAELPDVLDRVKKLSSSHPDFSLKNPNRCRALIMTFAMNAAAFHDEEGRGYEFLGDMLEQIDTINSKVAARTTASCLIGWKKYSERRATLMKKQLQRLKDMPNVSNDLLEIVTKGLN